MNQSELQAELERLKAENTALKANKGPRKITLKVGQAGGLSVYGLGRYPVTLYRSQWEQLIATVPEINAFIEANADKLVVKDPK